MVLIRSRVVLLLAVVLYVLVAASPPAGAEGHDRAAVGRALVVLGDWDAARAAAYADDDAAALRQLYSYGSDAGLADLRLLREYADRGLRVRRLRTQVFSARVLAESRDRLRMLVLDRVVAEATAGGRWLAVPRSAPHERAIVLRRSPSAGWQVASVRLVG